MTQTDHYKEQRGNVRYERIRTTTGTIHRVSMPTVCGQVGLSFDSSTLARKVFNLQEKDIVALIQG